MTLGRHSLPRSSDLCERIFWGAWLGLRACSRVSDFGDFCERMFVEL